MTTFLFFLVNPPLNEFVWAGWERKKRTTEMWFKLCYNYNRKLKLVGIREDALAY